MVKDNALLPHPGESLEHLLLHRIPAEAEVVMIGEASHGTGGALASLHRLPAWPGLAALLEEAGARTTVTGEGGRATRSKADSGMAWRSLCSRPRLPAAWPRFLPGCAADDFYRMRADITKMLIQERGFNGGEDWRGRGCDVGRRAARKDGRPASTMLVPLQTSMRAAACTATYHTEVLAKCFYLLPSCTLLAHVWQAGACNRHH